MQHEFDVHRFHSLKAQADDVLGLRERAARLLAARPLRSFDGFGHFLDAVLGEDVACAEALATTAHISFGAIDQLRASELDPFAGSVGPITYIGFLLGIEEDDFQRLVRIDHTRFARYADSVLSRSGDDAAEDMATKIAELWSRFESDRGSSL